MREPLVLILAIASVVILILTLGIASMRNEKTIKQLREQIVRDSLMDKMQEDIDSAQARWRSRCYLIAIEKSLDPQEICDV